METEKVSKTFNFYSKLMLLIAQEDFVNENVHLHRLPSMHVDYETGILLLLPFLAHSISL
jgi:hypothetical protein